MTCELDEAKQLILAAQSEVDAIRRHIQLIDDLLDECMGAVCLADTRAEVDELMARAQAQASEAGSK